MNKVKLPNQNQDRCLDPLNITIGYLEGATIALRWCISPQTADMLVANNAKKTYVLVAVVDEIRKEEVDRFVYPLTQEMAYISFRRPGLNSMHATIVYGDKTVKKNILAKTDNGNRCMAVIEEKSNNSASNVGICNQLGDVSRIRYECCIGVVITDCMFAPKPMKLTKVLANLYDFWDRSPRNQCELRNRVIFTAMTVIPYLLAVGMYYVLGLLVTDAIVFISIVRHRNVNYQPMLSDFKDFEKFLIGFCRDSLFGGVRKIQDSYLIHNLWLLSKRTQKANHKFVSDLNSLVYHMSDGRRDAILKSLPLRRQTVRLHLVNIKRKVCLPFADNYY